MFRHDFALNVNSATAHVGMWVISPERRCANSVNSGLWPKSITRSDDACGAVRERARATDPLHRAGIDPDPLGQGIVASLARPAGNITGGTQDDSAEIAARRVQLLKDALPQTARLAVLLNPDLPYTQLQWQQLERAAPSLKLEAAP